MRITGGIYGRRILKVPGGDLRPTQDKVRAALFSILAERTPGCAFLDLFAGSGAVGIEALSRGARAVGWVEANRHTLATLRHNVETLTGPTDTGNTASLRFHGADVFTFLKKQLEPEKYDIIFADPPYDRQNRLEWTARILDAVRDSGRLGPGGWVIIEEPVGSISGTPAGWSRVKEKAYGGTRLTFYAMQGGTTQ